MSDQTVDKAPHAGPHHQLRWYQSLYAKLCLVQFILLLILGSLVLVLFLRFTRSFSSESAQLINWGLAAELATAFEPLVSEGIDYIALEKRFLDATTLNPRIRIFLLDSGGKIITSSIDSSRIIRDRVGTGPLESFLNARYAARTPILGDDPATRSSMTVFSAARVRIQKESGFLYVLLDSGGSSIISEVLESSYLMRSSAALIVLALLLVWIIGTLTFSYLTTPLRRMTSAVRMFGTGDYSKRVDYERSDELGLLAETYNSMADTLVDTVRQLEHTDRLRRELVANVAHDLRGPLTVAFGYLETISLREVPMSESARDKAIDIASRNVRSLCRLVDSLFELATIEARDAAPQMKPIALTDFFESLSLRFEQTAEDAQISLRTEVPSSNAAVLADPGLLERAVSNLVENAIKYSPPGTQVRLIATQEGAKFRIEVRDTGPGIPAEDLPRIFEIFYRSSAASQSKQGTGLGLAIAQRIIRLHGADLTVESTVGKGTTFHFSISGYWAASAAALPAPGRA